VPLPAYDNDDYGVHETRRFVHLPPVHVQLSTLHIHTGETQSVARCESLGANVNYYKVLSIVVGRRFISLSLGVARRGNAHAVIQPMARRRRRTSLMNYFPQMLIRVSAAATPLLPATIERHELKSGGSIAYYIYLHSMRLLG
jgi:hypothetical protein